MAKRVEYNEKDVYRGLMSAIIHRAIQDYRGKLFQGERTDKFGYGSKRLLIARAKEFFYSEDFIHYCEVLDIDYKIILKNLDL